MMLDFEAVVKSGLDKELCTKFDQAVPLGCGADTPCSTTASTVLCRSLAPDPASAAPPISCEVVASCEDSDLDIDLEEGMLKADAKCNRKSLGGMMLAPDPGASPCSSRAVSPMPNERPANPEPPASPVSPRPDPIGPYPDSQHADLDVDLEQVMLKADAQESKRLQGDPFRMGDATGPVSPCHFLAPSPLPSEVARPANPEPPASPMPGAELETDGDLDADLDQGMMTCNNSMLNCPGTAEAPSRAESRIGVASASLVHVDVVDVEPAESLEVDAELDVDMDLQMMKVDSRLDSRNGTGHHYLPANALAVDCGRGSACGFHEPLADSRADSAMGSRVNSAMGRRPDEPEPLTPRPPGARDKDRAQTCDFAQCGVEDHSIELNQSRLIPEAEFVVPNSVCRGRSLTRDRGEYSNHSSTPNWASPLPSPRRTVQDPGWPEDAAPLDAMQLPSASCSMQEEQAACFTLAEAQASMKPCAREALQEQVWSTLRQQCQDAPAGTKKWLKEKLLEIRHITPSVVAVECLPSSSSRPELPRASAWQPTSTVSTDLARTLLEVISSSSQRAASLAAAVAGLHRHLEERDRYAAALESNATNAWQKVAELQETAEVVARRAMEEEARYLRLREEYQQPLLRLEKESLQAKHTQLDELLNARADSRCSAASCSSSLRPLGCIVPPRPASALDVIGRMPVFP